MFSYVTLISGSIMFNSLLKEKEFTFMMVMASFTNFVGAILTMLFCRGYYFGLPKFLYVCFTSTVTDTLYQCFNTLPLMVMFAKLIPEKVEASLFAFLTGLSNLCNLFLSGNLGNLINLWVGVTDSYDSLAANTWKLYAIQAVCSLLPLAFIWLIPTREQVAKVQRCNEYLELYGGKDEADCSNIYEDYAKLSPSVAKRVGVKPPKGND